MCSRLVVGLAVVCSLPAIVVCQQKQHEVHGSGSSPQAIKFAIDQPYCSDRADAPYHYEDGIATDTPDAQKSTVAALPVTAPIADLRKFDDSGKEIVSSSKTSLMSDGSDASRLLVRSFFAGTCSKQKLIKSTVALPEKLLSANYYVINIVVWKHSAMGEKTWYQVQSSEWYVFNTSDKSVFHQTPFRPFHPTLSADNRIYGSKTVGFLAVHIKPADTDAEQFSKFQITYNVNIKEKQPINVQDLIALIDVVTSTGGLAATAKVALNPKMIGLYGGGLIGPIAKLPDDMEFAANVVFPDTQSKPGEKVSAALVVRDQVGFSYRPAKFLASGFAARRSAVDSAQAAAAPPPPPPDPKANASVTCDTTIDPTTHKQSPCLFSKTYDNEGLYHWDVSVGVPVKSVKELQYASTDGSVTAKNVSRLNAYGFFDIYPVATDLKAPPAFAWPHFMVGLPFSGKVFNKPFFGSGGVVNLQQIPKIGPGLSKIIPVKFNFYGGVVYNKEFRPSSLAVGDPASSGAVTNSLVPHRVWKGQFGIEFSIRDVKDKLTAAKKSTANGTNSAKVSSNP
jgi:hypothetical protein